MGEPSTAVVIRRTGPGPSELGSGAEANRPLPRTDATPLEVTPAPASRSALDRAGARLRNTFNATVESMLETLEAREPWERYRPRSTTLPPTFPPRVDTPVTDDLPPALRGMVYRSAHDIHYDGDFTLPGRPNAAVRFSDVMAQPNWPDLVGTQLSVGRARPGDPIRVLVPGLNTENLETERRLHVVARDTDFAVAQLDNGSTADLDPIVITLPGGKEVSIPPRHREWLSAIFQRIDLSFQPRAELAPDMPRDGQGRVEVPPGSGQWLSPQELRGLRTALNELSDPNKQIIDNVQRLLMAHIDRADAPPLELWGYSEGTIVLGLAFEDLEARYLAERMRNCPPQQRTQRLAMLKQRFRSRLDRITALCIGSAYDQFATPVRRIDFYADGARDPVARFAGSSRMTSFFRAINDTVFISERFDAMIAYKQPFSGFDAHNLFAAGGNALALYMEKNGTRSVRDLYERERLGTLVHPTLDEVKERVRRNGSERELWEPQNAYK